jgi:hydroxyacyl-ACP dehydratase HTD2-like protein with hotdog domain
MDELREVITPDRYVTYRYAGASGDFNPIHLDDEFARSVDLPGKILHGLWSMAQVARVASGDDPLALKSLSVQFRGMGVPEKEIVITGKPRGEHELDLEAVQDGNKLVRRGRAVLRS